MKRVEITWRDSMGEGGMWCRREDVERATAEADYLDCQSVGYLVTETDTILTLAQSTNAGGQIGHIITIPREAVTKVRTLK